MNLKGVHWDRYEASITRRNRQQTKEPKYNFEYKICYIQEHITECYLLVFRIENTLDGWDISYSKMPSLSMLAGLSRHEAKFPGNIFLLIKKIQMFLNCWNWKIQIDVCSANYQFEEIWNIVLRQKTLET